MNIKQLIYHPKDIDTLAGMLTREQVGDLSNSNGIGMNPDSIIYSNITDDFAFEHNLNNISRFEIEFGVCINSTNPFSIYIIWSLIGYYRDYKKYENIIKKFFRFYLHV